MSDSAQKKAQEAQEPEESKAPQAESASNDLKGPGWLRLLFRILSPFAAIFHFLFRILLHPKILTLLVMAAIIGVTLFVGIGPKWLFKPDHFFWGKNLLTTIIALTIMGVFTFMFVAFGAMMIVWLERRLAGRMQSRIGPNRVGIEGLLQLVMDGAKLIMKEDVEPAAVDKPLYKIAPYLIFTAMFCLWVVIPFSPGHVAADLNIGIYYFIAISSLVPVALLMSGWGSNDKWSLLGGLRSCAQLVSYEIPAGIAILCVLLYTGSMSTQTIVKSQGFWPWEWNIAHSPFLFVAFFVYFATALAEGNRTPFDLPEAEQELVAGYNTEYSGMRFVLFLFAEWITIYIAGAIVTVLFLGGWQMPDVLAAYLKTLPAWTQTLGLENLVGFVILFGKANLLVWVIIQLRWTLPRTRVDQLMEFSWKSLVPFGLVCLFGTALWVYFVPHVPTAAYFSALMPHLQDQPNEMAVLAAQYKLSPFSFVWFVRVLMALLVLAIPTWLFVKAYQNHKKTNAGFHFGWFLRP